MENNIEKLSILKTYCIKEKSLRQELENKNKKLTFLNDSLIANLKEKVF